MKNTPTDEPPASPPQEEKKVEDKEMEETIKPPLEHKEDESSKPKVYPKPVPKSEPKKTQISKSQISDKEIAAINALRASNEKRAWNIEECRGQTTFFTSGKNSHQAAPRQVEPDESMLMMKT